ncbi:MAG: U32 family peptidase [Spirochaetes bacterium]|nr:U32 family peptidase [Spirochaetota bacterium]
MKYRPELLAPAGNMEKLLFAFQYGADSAYLGGQYFNLRERAGNFSSLELKKAVQLASELNKKIYFTLNSSFRNSDFKKLELLCERLLKTGIKNLIISDLGALEFINKYYKKAFHISISTQANITNFHALSLLKKLNASRVILARELDLNEISQIKKKSDLELENFIHGAMCVAFSGRCLLSEYLTGRNANRGDCTQSCRWDYYITEKTRKDEFFPIIEDKEGTTILSSRDLCTLDILKRLMSIRIDSFKIEGRMKSLYYVANVTRVYRNAIDSILAHRKMDRDLLFRELDSVSHRPYFTGFYTSDKRSITHDRSYIRKFEFLGYLKRRVKDDLFELVLKNKLEEGDKIQLIMPDMKNHNLKKFTLYDKNYKRVKRGVINQRFYIELTGDASEYGILRKKLGK